MTNFKFEKSKSVTILILTVVFIFLVACNARDDNQDIAEPSVGYLPAYETTYDSILQEYYEDYSDTEDIIPAYYYIDEDLYDMNLSERINHYLQRHNNIRGLGLAVFTRDDMLLEIAHGYSDSEVGIAVSADTVFEWGSITKLLVYVSVMQLYERGELDLHSDIFAYISGEDFPNIVYPITMHHLIHHTAGFSNPELEPADQQEFGALIFSNPGNYVPSLEETIRNLSASGFFVQSDRPGERVEYINYGIVLAGYVVQRISGMPFHKYVHRNIFTPLGMYHTALHPELTDNEWVQEQREKIKPYGRWGVLFPPRLQILEYPAGAAVGTISDMVRFARGLMPDENGGSALFKDSATLSKFLPSLEDVLELDFVHDEIFSFDELVFFNGFIVPIQAAITIGHGGGIPGFRSLLFIDLDRGVGMIMSENTAFGLQVQTGFLDFFIQDIPKLALEM